MFYLYIHIYTSTYMYLSCLELPQHIELLILYSLKTHCSIGPLQLRPPQGSLISRGTFFEPSHKPQIACPRPVGEFFCQAWNPLFLLVSLGCSGLRCCRSRWSKSMWATSLAILVTPSMFKDSASFDGFLPPLLRSHYCENCQREQCEASWIQDGGCHRIL